MSRAKFEVKPRTFMGVEHGMVEVTWNGQLICSIYPEDESVPGIRIVSSYKPTLAVEMPQGRVPGIVSLYYIPAADCPGSDAEPVAHYAMPKLVESGSSPAFATIGEAAKFLRLSRSMVHKQIREKKIPCTRFGRSVRIPWGFLKGSDR